MNSADNLKVYRDNDADLGFLEGKKIAVIGYGKQGRSQALNLRDSGVSVHVASIRDSSAEKAEQDGFSVVPIDGCVGTADIFLMLIPDEVQRDVYEKSLANDLKAGQALCFAHGYNYHFGLIKPAPEVDVFMVAPRMVGAIVRESYKKGVGAPAFVALGQDGSGHTHQTMLAVAKGIGATKAGVIETTFEQETVLDLFMEQAFFPVFSQTFFTAFDVLKEAGFDPRMLALEMYGSGEVAEIMKAAGDIGFLQQLVLLHSRTSQYGTLSRTPGAYSETTKSRMMDALENIRNGGFAKEWAEEEKAGYPVYNKLVEGIKTHPLTVAEEGLHNLIDLRH